MNETWLGWVVAHALLQAGIEAGADSGGPGGWRILLTFFLIVTPIYLFMLFFVRIVRESYGFVGVRDDDGPPIRVCYQCNNTVLEPGYVHCPYCGEPLPEELPADEDCGDAPDAGDDPESRVAEDGSVPAHDA